jgi:hypothetical protein
MKKSERNTNNDVLIQIPNAAEERRPSRGNAEENGRDGERFAIQILFGGT